jgi:hypothetical protein
MAQPDRFRVLFEHSSDAYLIFDETGITDCNEATIKLLKAADRAKVLALHPASNRPAGNERQGVRVPPRG